MKKKIIIFSGSRADFGILKNIYFNFKKRKDCNAKFCLGSQHFNNQFNNTYLEAKKEKIKINLRLSYNLKKTTRGEIINQLSKNMKQINKILIKLKPDISIILGDRYEVHNFGLCCYILGIPIAHIHGGEITSGSFDDGFRHSLSKLSNLHFVSHLEHKKRLINLGENPKFIYNYGSPAAENVKKIKKSKKLDINLINKFKKNLITVTYHPQTNKKLGEDLDVLKNIFRLIKLNKQYNFIFTNSNSDPGGLKLINKINNFCNKNSNCFNAKSLGHENYLILIKHSKLIIGNSSSGIIEGSTLQVPFLNIGDRQKGRLKSNNVFDSKSDFKSINKNFKNIIKFQKNNIKEIFYKKNTSKKIVNTILKYLKKKIYHPKIFYEKK